METNLNSLEMKTIVETFIIEETQELIYDNEKLDKWNDLVKDLNLKGQTKIVRPEKSPIPFTFLKETLKNTFECLCPVKVDVEAYDKTPIPVEILDLIALSVKENYFNKVQIWYDDISPDPACIGVLSSFIIHKGDSWMKMDNTPSFRTEKECKKYIKDNDLDGKTYNESNQYYLLGKWADVKRSFDELSKMATVRYINTQGASYEETIKTYKQYLSNLKNESLKRFGFASKENAVSEDDLPF